MGDTPTSPLSQLLNTLGITKEDLNRRSDQMRQFLTQDSTNSSRTVSQLPPTSSQSRPVSRSSSEAAPLTRQIMGSTSNSTRDASSSPAPVEKDSENLLTRPLDNMELVLERQRLHRKQRRSKKRETDPPDSSARDSSPTPGPSRSEPTKDVAHDLPVASSSNLTPTRTSHYRDASGLATTTTQSPSIPRSATNRPYPYYYYPNYGTESQFLSLPFRSQGTTLPQTPVKGSQNTQSLAVSPQKSPLPPSSPPDDSSPASSPVARRVDTVSSPVQEVSGSTKGLPYTLPPGPYSTQRPHHSYAGIIGQAILSSKDHRLTLQEIYDWICTVYPHFKRGERTWMNSIRHVLSTTVHFRKITRERSAGRSYWAILDEDLHCFASGGYRKPGSLKRGGGGITVTRPPPKAKKRGMDEVDDDDDEVESSPQVAKRPKTASTDLLPSPQFASQPPGLLPDLVHDKPGKSKRPTTQQQTYYETCVSTAPTYSTADIIFPRIPKSSSYRLISSSPAKNVVEPESDEELPPSSTGLQPSSSPPSSVPALTPHASSSSPMPLSDPEQEVEENSAVIVEDDLEQAETELAVVDDTTKSTSDAETLQPGIDLVIAEDKSDSDSDDDDVPLLLLSQGTTRKRTASKHRPSSSPTLHRRKTATAARSSKSAKHKKHKSVPVVPSTPPRNASPTPSFRKGLLSSPSAGYSFISGSPARISAARDDIDDEPHDPLRTPSRKGKLAASSNSGLFPVTPQRRLLLPSDSSSPFRTPGGNMLSLSPFRTPSSGRRGVGIFDPHDPSTMLDEELSSFKAAVGGESPAGLYAKGDLYSSPNPVEGSPGKWARWW